jgi:hypothetical protein
MLKVFMDLGAGFFLVAAFFAYAEDLWTSVLFVVFSAGCAITARKCF